MYRVVFCPDEGMIEEAEELARRNHLPILVGRNQRLDGVDFDDSSVAVIEIPTDRSTTYQENVIRVGGIHVVEYVDDYEEMSESTEMVVESPSGSTNTVSPTMSERHFVRFAHRPSEDGVHKFLIRDGDKTLSSGSFTVGGR